MKHKVLFVCLGNICRSPAAEGVMQHIVTVAGAAADYYIDSAGTYGGHRGQKADPRMRQAAAKRGYELTSKSRQICLDDFETFNMIVVMDDSNYQRVHRLAQSTEAANKIFRMAEFSNTIVFDHVPDPYYEGVEGFEKVLDILEDSCAVLFEKLQRDDM